MFKNFNSTVSKKIMSKKVIFFHVTESMILSQTRGKYFFTDQKIIFLHRPEDEDDDEEVVVPPPKMNYKRRSLNNFLNRTMSYFVLLGPMLPYRRQILDWIVGLGYSWGGHILECSQRLASFLRHSARIGAGSQLTSGQE